MEHIKKSLNGCNPFVKQYRNAATRIKKSGAREFNLRLLSVRNRDGRMYNIPTASEVAALVVGDIDMSFSVRDVINEFKKGKPKRINELHTAYLPLQYPLLFPHGEDGYRDDVRHYHNGVPNMRSRTRVSMREFFAFRLMGREAETSLLLNASKLLQQFIEDGYTMMESQRLLWVKTHQKELRVDLYQGLSDAVIRGETNASATGKRIILPSSFTGGARYMVQNYQDAMAFCRWAGYPDIFLTFTCNANWPEIRRFTDPLKIKPSCRTDICTRVFKMKLRTLMNTIKEEQIFGRVKAGM